MSSFQKRASEANYPRCPICGLCVPKAAFDRLAASGACDFCVRAGVNVRDHWPEPEGGFASPRADRYERYGEVDGND